MRDDVIVLLLAAMRPDALWWGWSRIVSRDRPLRHLKGLRFAKALGSGFEGGFGVRPSKDRQGLFLVFDGEAAADDFLADSLTLQGYADHARELFVTKLRATSARGRWSGQPLGVSAVAPPEARVIAALTRASIRPSKALQFWPLAPPAQAALEAAPGCRWPWAWEKRPCCARPPSASGRTRLRWKPTRAAVPTGWQRARPTAMASSARRCSRALCP
jgi:hypothetical protein